MRAFGVSFGTTNGVRFVLFDHLVCCSTHVISLDYLRFIVTFETIVRRRKNLVRVNPESVCHDDKRVMRTAVSQVLRPDRAHLLDGGVLGK